MVRRAAACPYRGPVSIAAFRPSPGDVALTTVLVALGQLTTWLQLDTPDAFAGDRPANAVMVLLGTLPLLWRRWAPTGVAVVSAAFLCLPPTVTPLDVTVLGQFVPLIVVTASCGYHALAARAIAGAAFAEASMLALSLATPFLRTPTSVAFNTLILLAPWAAARGLRHREDRARRLGAALAHEQARFESRMAEAVESERAEIARDLHDIVAHGVSVMVVQVGGARMQLADDPDRAARSLLQAEEAGRQALADLRRMLGVLRSTSQPAASTTIPQPRPGLDQLPGLVQQARDAGLDLQTSVTGDLEGLPPAIDVSAYRIVQEAVTNALKHDRSGRAWLGIGTEHGLLSITVRNSGGARHPDGSDGYGLVGIRERVSFLGGQARIGPAPSGGWQVAVEIPVAASPHPAGPERLPT